MEPITLIATVAGYLAKKLKDNESVKDFFNDFTEATVNWIKPIFITEDEKPKEMIEDLAADPTDPLNTQSVENALAKALKKDPKGEAFLKEMYDTIQKKASQGQSIVITDSNNVNTGNVNTGGGDFRIGDTTRN